MDICAACLSTGRKLTPLKSLYYYLNEWRNLEIQLNGGICWECKAMLKKMCNFKMKVTKAQKYLNIVKFNPTLAKPLSNLAIHHVHVHHISHDEQADSTKIYDFKLEPTYEYEELNDDIYFEVDFEPEVKEEEYAPVEKKKVNSKIFKILHMSEEEMLKTRHQDRLKNSFLFRPYKCEDCLVAYSYNKQYLTHRLKNHSEKNGPFKCPICLCYYSTDSLMAKHKKTHYMLHQCVLCKQVENSKSKILHHYNNVHRDGPGKNVEKGLTTAAVDDQPATTEHLQSCDICGKKFIKKGALKKHMERHGSCFECDHCQKTFEDKRKLRAHLKWIHPVTKEDCYCVECDKHFKNNVIYRRHLQHSRMHTKDEHLKHQCTECNKKFFDRTTFTRHLHKHFRILDHKCHMCVKSFIRKDQLDKHVRHIHEGVPRPKNKQCTICGRGFTRMATLLNHIRTHTGDKPFQCTFCDSAFAQKASLTSHIKAVHLRVPKKIKFER